mmetsp:Transcript_4359/g.9152  ORF Transcript_4359/g.9152 Transcript_4359/m.9152 type:complete len:212 (+) Transcript_4359:1-636(+)
MKVATLHESLKSCETSKRSSIFGSAFHSPFLSSSTTSSHQRRRLSIFATRKDSADGAAADSHHREADHKIHHVNGEQASSSPGHLRQTLFKVLSIARLERPDGAGHRRVSTVSSSIGRSKKGEGTERPFKGLVKFSDVTIREFDLTASDNPAVRGGAAIEVRGVVPLWQLGGGGTGGNNYMMCVSVLWHGLGAKSPPFSLEKPLCFLLTLF